MSRSRKGVRRKRGKKSSKQDSAQMRYMYQGQGGFDASDAMKPAQAPPVSSEAVADNQQLSSEQQDRKRQLPEHSPWLEQAEQEAHQEVKQAQEDHEMRHLLSDPLDNFAPKRGVRFALEIAATVLLSIVLVLACLGTALSLVTFAPLNTQLVGLVHSENGDVVIGAYQNVAADTLRYVSTLPIETAPALQVHAEDIAILNQQPFTANELSHLTDVRILLGGSLLLTYTLVVVSMVAIVALRKLQLARRSLLAAGITCLALPLVGGAFMFFAFDPTFVLFHEVFFPQGNWEFPTTSLIISTFPGEYWRLVGMLWMGFFLIGGLILIGLSRFCGKMYAWSVTNS